jgi:hypothetical protein
MGFSVYTENQDIKNNSFQNIANNISSISTNIDLAVEDLEITSANIIYSNLIKQNFFSIIEQHSTGQADQIKTNSTQYSNVQDTKLLVDLLVSISGPSTPVDQITLYSLTPGTFKVGLNNSFSPERVQDKSWFQKTYDLSGNKNIYLDEDPSLGKYFTHDNKNYFISLSRLYYNQYNIPQGIVEVKKNIKNIDAIITPYSLLYDEKIVIFDPIGNVIHPLSSSTDYQGYYDIINNSKASNVTPLVSKIQLRDTDEYIFYSKSSDTNFITAIVLDLSLIHNSEPTRPLYISYAVFWL